MLPFNMHSKRVFGVVSTEALWTLVGHLAVVGLDVREEVGLEGCGVGTISAAPASAVRQSLHLPFYRCMVALDVLIQMSSVGSCVIAVGAHPRTVNF